MENNYVEKEEVENLLSGFGFLKGEVFGGFVKDKAGG